MSVDAFIVFERCRFFDGRLFVNKLLRKVFSPKTVLRRWKASCILITVYLPLIMPNYRPLSRRKDGKSAELCYGTLTFIIVFIKFHHWNLSWANSIQSITPCFCKIQSVHNILTLRSNSLYWISVLYLHI